MINKGKMKMAVTKKEIVCYGTDASRIFGRAEKVFFPRDSNEVIEIIKSYMNLVPRGAGSGLVGGCVPDNSIIVDISKMNKVYNFNSAKRSVYAEAGVTLRELNEKLRSKGFEFPIQLSNQGISTIGGMIATNASGKRNMKYGVMRDWVEEIELVNGKGELIKVSRADLMDVCGMEGITGIITSAKLKVMPIIKRSFSVFQSDNISDIISVARRLKSENDVVCLELLPPVISELIGFPKKYNLFIEFDSIRGKITGDEYDSLLNKLNRLYYSIALEGNYIDEDPKLFFDKMKEFIQILEENNIPYICYPGSGIIHCYFKENEKIKIEKIMEFMKKSKAKFAKYGIGIKRKSFLENFEVKIIQRTKSRYDPDGKINKGKMIDFFQTPVEFKREEKTAKEVISEMPEGQLKTPEEKINELIKEAVKEEIKEKEIIIKEERLLPINNKTSVNYKDIINIMTNKHSNNSEIQKPLPINNKTDDENDLIKRIMTNKFKRNENSNQEVK